MSTDSQRLATNPVADATLTTLDDGLHELRWERRLRHPVDRVWRAISEPSELAHWFPANVEWDLRPGGAVHYHFPNEGPGGDGEIIELDPPNALEFTWADEILRFELQPDGDACLLSFIHTFHDGKGAAKFAAGWHGCLIWLDSLLAGKRAEESLSGWDEVYEGYVKKFSSETGVSDMRQVTPPADGTLETSGGKYVLRFERYFNRPLERVWAALTRPEELVKWLAEAEVEQTVGGHFNLRWLNTDNPIEEGAASDMKGTITRLEWPNLLEVDSDIHGLLRWELREEGPGCLLTFSATLSDPSDSLSELLAGWHIHLDHLDSALHGHPIDWSRWALDHWDTFAGYQERYAVALT